MVSKSGLRCSGRALSEPASDVHLAAYRTLRRREVQRMRRARRRARIAELGRRLADWRMRFALLRMQVGYRLRDARGRRCRSAASRSGTGTVWRRKSGLVLGFIVVLCTPGRILSAASAGVGKSLAGLFAERQVIFRHGGEVRYVSLRRSTQMAVAVGLLASGAWIGFATNYYFSFDRVLRRERARTTEWRNAHDEVMRELNRYYGRVNSITAQLEQTRNKLDVLMADAGMPEMRSTADNMADGGVMLAEAADVDLGSPSPEVGEMRKVWGGLTQRGRGLEHEYSILESDVASLVDEREQVTAQRNRLSEKVERLETTLASLRRSQEQVLRRVTKNTSNTVIEVEKLIAMTGLDPDKMLARLKRKDRIAARTMPHGQGGPFLQLASLSLPPDEPLNANVAALDLQMGRWHNLQRVLRMLPLASPVDHYRLTSGFGKRVDPIRKRWSFHPGVDLANRLGTAILAPAPGVVTSTGRRAGYGRMVEIDHGLGITTRYGHLRKILVKEGQKVGFRDEIALMGSSGRSTGTHLHYEVRVDGRPVNPLKFMKAGKYVFKGK